MPAPSLRRLALVLCLFATPLAAQDTPDMSQVSAAFAAGDLETARTMLTQIVEDSPTPAAQFRYARMLIEGLGGPADQEAGLQYLQAAAQAGQPGAMVYLGDLLSEQEPEAALRLFERAAAQGHNPARYRLGVAYLTGRGTAPDEDRALTWLNTAAQDGFGPALFALSRFYAQGPDGPRNAGEAQRLLEAAAAAGVAEAQVAVAGRLLGDNRIDDAIILLTNAAVQGNVEAQRTLGTLYLTGREGLEPDGAQAERWLAAAVRQRDLVALLNLGLSYLEGNAIPARPEQGRDMLLVASDNGVGRASFALARAYEAGTPPPQDMDEALAFYRLADEQGEPRAARRLGQMILEGTSGLSVAPHVATPWVMARLEASGASDALAWLEARAAEGVRPAQAMLGQWALEQPDRATEGRALLEAAARRGHVPSQYRLGEALVKGIGGPVDYVAAHGWLNVAATSGHVQATETRDTITALMTPEQIAAAHDFTRAFLAAPPPVASGAGE